MRSLVIFLCLCQMPKRKGASLFHVASKCFWGRINCNEVSKFSVWSLFFKAGVPVPAPQLGQLIWLQLSMVPSVHTLHGKTVRDIKETVFGKGRLGWGVAETCSLTLAPLISVHSRPTLFISDSFWLSIECAESPLWYCKAYKLSVTRWCVLYWHIYYYGLSWCIDMGGGIKGESDNMIFSRRFYQRNRRAHKPGRQAFHSAEVGHWPNNGPKEGSILDGD